MNISVNSVIFYSITDFFVKLTKFTKLHIKGELHMAKKNGAQSVEVIPGRRIVLSAGVGKTNIDELKWLTETVLAEAAAWKATGWAYIADCSQMSPVSPAEGGELVTMTKKFVDAGCKAMGFAEGSSVMLKVQATFWKKSKKN